MMTSFVVDASVGIKWFLPERQELEAEHLLGGAYTLLVPELLYSEIANIFWKRVTFNGLDRTIAQKAIKALGSFCLESFTCASLFKDAFEIATLTGCTAYDGLYVALAVQEDAQLITVDKRLVSTLRSTPLEKYIVLLGSSDI